LKKKKVVQSEESAFQIPFKQSGFKDPEHEKKKVVQSEENAFQIPFKHSGFKDPELEKKKVVQSEESSYQIPLKQSGFKDPELEKPKKNEESKPIFASVQLKGKGEFKDPEHEKQRKSLTNELPPEFGKVQLRRSDKNYDSLEKEIQRKSSGDYLISMFH